MSATADFFRSRLDQMIGLRHPLAVLACRMPWQELEANIAHLFAKRVRAGKDISDVDLFGGVAKVVGSGISPAGRCGCRDGAVDGINVHHIHASSAVKSSAGSLKVNSSETTKSLPASRTTRSSGLSSCCPGTSRSRVTHQANKRSCRRLHDG